MRRSIKLVLLLLLVTILIGTGLIIPFLQTEAYVEETNITSNIFQVGILVPSFEGFIVIENVVYIYNSGYLDINDVIISINAYFISNFDQDSRYEIGSGENNIEIIESKSNNSYTISLNATEKIAIMAVSDGIIEIEINVKVPLPMISYILELDIFEDEEWNAPFF